MLVREQPDVKLLAYEERLVAFIDILGWGSAVSGPQARSAADLGWMVGLLQAVESSAAAHESFTATLPPGLSLPGVVPGVQVSQFSDSIVVSVPAGTAGGQWYIEQTLSQITAVAAQFRFLLRGGVAKGKLFHRDGMVFGPALIEAYKLEHQLAVYPRILLSKSLEDSFFPGSRLSDNGHVYGYRKAWRRDKDDLVFHDFMQPFGAVEIYPESGREAWQPHMHHLNQFKGTICRGLCEAPCEWILLKYEWARDYFSSIVDEYPGLEVRPFALEIGGELYGFEKLEWPKVQVSARG